MATVHDVDTNLDKFLILDFGSQYTHIIVRRCREAHVYSEMKRCDVSLDEMQAFGPAGVILSGGPSSVYEEGAPHVPAGFWDWVISKKIPVLGICYGLQEMIHSNGGKVESSTTREFGHAEIDIVRKPAPKTWFSACAPSSSCHPIFNGVTNHSRVWMSHGDSVTKLPENFSIIANTNTASFAAVAHDVYPWVGLQFHPEVAHTDEGFSVLKAFIFNMCNAKPTWSMEKFMEVEVDLLREKIGNATVIGALSGGVDSTVAAALMYKALGENFHGFLIDTGLLRMNEGPVVIQRLKEIMPGLNVVCIDARERFYNALAGVTEPEKKRKIIGKQFIEEFENAVANLGVEAEGSYLLQGTLYPDVIESVSFKGPSHTIKTHHNVGGLPEKMKMKILEPLRELFKDEVRHLGENLGVPADMVWRHPFPGPGLAVRILGEITPERVAVLQKADNIFIEELRAAGEYGKIGQAFVVLLPECKSVGVMGDCRTYEMTCVLRAVETSDFMTAEWFRLPYEVIAKVSSRITNEVRGINRVVYDVSSKPPATIEWE